MEFVNVLEGRRSVRKYKQEPISQETIQEIIRAGSCAPKPSNRQQWEIIVVDNKSVLERFIKEAGAQEHVLAAPTVLVIVVDTEFNKEHWSNIQATAAACQNMQLRAFDLGYGSCVMAGFGDGKAIKKILNVPDPWDVTCFMMLGKPDEAPSTPPKKHVEEILHYNTFVDRTERLPSSVRIKDWTLNQVRQHQKFASRAYRMGTDYEFYDPEEISKIQHIIKQYIPSQGKILNILGYDGTVLKHLQHLFPNHEFIDCELSPEAGEFVKSKTQNINFVTFTDKIEGVEDNTIDLVLLTFALEKSPEKEKLLGEAHRVLNPEGKLIAFVKNKASSYGLMYYAIIKLLGINHLEGFYIRSGPFEPVSIYQTKKLLQNNRFNIQDKKGIFLLPAEIKIYTKKVDGYLHRHGHKLSVFKYLIKPALWLGNFTFNSTKWINNPYLSSTICVIAKKQ
ncbi:MAG TPA: nitroreductase family protein [Candidatus Nanoarchaeia archaeon]|nr:nitroreductase family protein [Candidatus Nanoarchaeia archaeon]